MIKQLLTLVDSGFLWLSMSTLITDIMIHWITLLPHSRLNPAKEFSRKMSKHNLAGKMKDKFKIEKKSRRYSVTSIIDPVMKISTQILVRKVMKKCHADEVLTLVIPLTAQCIEARAVQLGVLHL